MAFCAEIFPRWTDWKRKSCCQFSESEPIVKSSHPRRVTLPARSIRTQQAEVGPDQNMSGYEQPLAGRPGGRSAGNPGTAGLSDQGRQEIAPCPTTPGTSRALSGQAEYQRLSDRRGLREGRPSGRPGDGNRRNAPARPKSSHEGLEGPQTIGSLGTLSHGPAGELPDAGQDNQALADHGPDSPLKLSKSAFDILERSGLICYNRRPDLSALAGVSPCEGPLKTEKNVFTPCFPMQIWSSRIRRLDSSRFCARAQKCEKPRA